MNQSILIKIIEQQIKDVLEIGNAKLPVNINFDQIEIKYNLKGLTAGKAQNLKNGKYRLWFNLIIMNDNLLEFERTIIHEIAHLYQYDLYKNSYIKSHGKEFHKINKILGNINSTRCHNYNVESIKELRKPKLKFIYTCSCNKNFKLSINLHNKINKGQNRICRNCRKKIVYTGQTILE